MRILGECPNCQSQDSIYEFKAPDDKFSVRCDNCRETWDESFKLCREEGKKGNLLIPVRVDIDHHFVKLRVSLSLSEIPFSRLIIQILNAALMQRFDLGVCLATEGGVQGSVDTKGCPRWWVELRNDYDSIGLWVDIDYQTAIHSTLQFVLDWYAQLLTILFEDELIIDGHNFGWGAILKLNEEELPKAFQILSLALYKKTGSRGFAAKVLERLERELRDPLGAPYLAGLTAEDINRFFVEPPLG